MKQKENKIDLTNGSWVSFSNYCSKNYFHGQEQLNIAGFNFFFIILNETSEHLFEFDATF